MEYHIRTYWPDDELVGWWEHYTSQLDPDNRFCDLKNNVELVEDLARIDFYHRGKSSHWREARSAMLKTVDFRRRQEARYRDNRDW